MFLECNPDEVGVRHSENIFLQAEHLLKLAAYEEADLPRPESADIKSPSTAV